MLMRTCRVASGLLSLAFLLLAVAACNTGGSSTSLTLIAPAAPGGGWDQTARVMQQALQQEGLGGTVKVVNVPGAGGTIGLAQLANAEKGRPDVLMTMGLVMVGAVLTNRAPVTIADVTPIARLTGEAEVLVVPSASPYRTLNEFIDAWRADPGLAIAGGSAGGTDHMLAGLLAQAVGIDVAKLNYVPHSGGGETLASLVGNQVAAGVNGLSELVAFVQSGQLRALAVSGDARVPGLDIPTLAEQGVDVVLSNWRGVIAAQGISAEQRAGLTSVLDRMHESAAWKAALDKYNWTDMYQTGPSFDAFLQQENERATAVLKSIGLVE